MMLKSFNKTGLLLLAFGSLLSTVDVNGETKSFVREYTYQSGEYDSRLTCRAIAMAEAKRLLLEELGTFLKSSTLVQNGMVVNDDISILTAGAVQTKLVEEKWDGDQYWIKVRMDADPDSVDLAVKRLREDQSKTAELEALRQKTDRAMLELNRLNQQLSQASSEASNFSDQIKYLENARRLSASELSQQGMAALMSNDYTGALLAYSKALELDSTDAASYVNRGIAYARAGDYQKAVQDYDRAARTMSQDHRLYYNRGIASYGLKQYAKALKDFNKAILLKPDHAKSYYNRAMTYEKSENWKLALLDYAKAIKLDPKDVQAYSNRGILYFQRKMYSQALEDFSQSVEVDPSFSDGYLNRALVRAVRGDMTAAIMDAKKAAELGNEDARLLLDKLGQ
jgi:tetratricopeptide (TPR) repeat protein